jgi:hypothetical protein
MVSPGPQQSLPKPAKADAVKVVKIISANKAKIAKTIGEHHASRHHRRCAAWDEFIAHAQIGGTIIR